jgi:hypothetical protein
MADRKIPEKVDADKFDAILKRLVDHKPVPKDRIRTSRKKKLGKIVEAPR